MSTDSLGSFDLLAALDADGPLKQNRSVFRESDIVTNENGILNSFNTLNTSLTDNTSFTTTTTGYLDSSDFTTLKSYSTTLEKVLRHSIADGSIFGFNGDDNNRISTEDLLGANVGSQTEVTIRRPEVLVENSGIGTPEKVVIGAVIIVVTLTIIAIILRVCMPIYRNRGKKEDAGDKTFYIDSSSSNDLSGYTNFAIDLDSQSSGNSQNNDWSQTTGSNPSSDWSQSTGSNSSTDWSEVSSDQTKSTTSCKRDTSEDENMGDRLHRHPGNGSLPSNYKTASTTSLPLYIQDERRSKSAKSSPMPHRKSPMNIRKYDDEMVSVISTKSLEPLRMEDVYRSRWDDQWDPYGSIPRGNLSHHSHPSESHLSLSSYSSSQNSSITFPIPSRQAIHKMATDQQDRRLPPNIRVTPVQAVKKEKHVRLTPPIDRRHPGLSRMK